MFRPVVPIALLLAGCAVNPVTGQRQFSLIPESQEIQIGKSGADDVVRSVGLVKNPPLEALVGDIGRKIATHSERPALPWTFRLIDDPAVNAFALPGGYIFVTRGLLAHMGSEAELAAVLGHEVGHVTAKHSVTQMSQQQLVMAGLGVGSALSPTIAKYGQVASAGLGLAFLKFGRDDESQADELGFRYALDQGWDVRAMPALFETLDRVSNAAGGGRMPEWLSTHPNPANREQVTKQRLAALTVDLSKANLNREGFVKLLDGLAFGENPRHGYFEGRAFLHPDLKLRVDFPEGWKAQNSPEAVVAQAPAGDGAVQLAFAAEDSPEAAMRKFVVQEGLSAPAFTTGKVRDWPSAETTFTIPSAEGGTQGRVTFVRVGTATLGLVGFARPDRFQAYDAAFKEVVASLQPLTDPKALAAEPAKLQIVALDKPMTLEEFHKASPSVIPITQLAIVNGVAANAQLPAGTLVKRVVGGTAAP